MLIPRALSISVCLISTAMSIKDAEKKEIQGGNVKEKCNQDENGYFQCFFFPFKMAVVET